MRRSKYLLFILLLPTCCRAQDTVPILGKDEFLSIVRSYHPVIRQAALQVDRAAAEVQAARGGFDPSIDAGIDRKTFDGKLYYSYFHPRLTIPTWYGIDIKAGLEEVAGIRVTPEATPGKTSYVGVKVPANNLLFDRRRAALRQAQSFRQMSEAERSLTVNDLLYGALSAYWNWVREYLNYIVIDKAVKVNEERLKYVRTEYEQGSRPAIDTTEVLAQLQNFYLQRNDSRLAFENAGLELSNYLWLENDVPAGWAGNIIPPESEIYKDDVLPVLEQLISTAGDNHPKLRSLSFKTDVLETERRLKAQYLLPKLNVNANLLNKGYMAPGDLTVAFAENNYKVGIDFSLPLLQRAARGNYRSAAIKLRETALEQELIALKIENKIKSHYNEVLQFGRQIALYEQTLNNYQKLFQGEKIRFEAGESTLFLLNSRENKVLEATQKLYELRTKWHKSYAALLWAAGRLS